MYQPMDHDGTRTLKKKVDFSSCVQVTNKEREMLENLKNINIKMLRFSSKFNQKHELHYGEKWLHIDEKETEGNQPRKVCYFIKTYTRLWNVNHDGIEEWINQDKTLLTDYDVVALVSHVGDDRLDANVR